MPAWFMSLALSLGTCLSCPPASCAQDDLQRTVCSSSSFRVMNSNGQTSVPAGAKHGIQLGFIPSIDNPYSSIELLYRRGSPSSERNKLEWGGGIRFSQITDARGDKDYGAAVCVFITRRILGKNRLFLLPKLGFDVDYTWRKDDEDRFVNTLLFSVYPVLNVEILGSKKTVFVIGAGYRFATSSDWQRPGKWEDAEWGEESEITPGVWRKDEPTMNMSGFFLTVGLEFLLR